MESPQNGRAIITDNIDSLTITIPTRKYWFLILFLGAWLGGWFMGEYFAISTFFQPDLELSGGQFFLFFWLCAWTVGGVFVITTLSWMIIGQEIIEIGQGQLSITQKGALFITPKVYDLKEAKNFRIQETETYPDNIYGGRKPNIGPFNQQGNILFDYGLKTIKFGGQIDKIEAAHILETLKTKRILTEQHF